MADLKDNPTLQIAEGKADEACELAGLAAAASADTTKPPPLSGGAPDGLPATPREGESTSGAVALKDSNNGDPKGEEGMEQASQPSSRDI